MKSTLAWKSINALGKNRAIQSSYIFFVLVPIIVKLYTTSETAILVKFDLPFSWVALFFAALTVSVANTIYFVFCPELVKTFSNYIEFVHSGRGATFMANQLQSYAPGYLRRKSLDDIADYLYQEYKDYLNVDQSVLPKVKQDLKTPGAQASQAMFWTTYDIANNIYPLLRFIASWLYYIGFALLVWVFANNIWSVIEYLCRTNGST